MLLSSSSEKRDVAMSDSEISAVIVILTFACAVLALVFRKRTLAAVSAQTVGTENIAVKYTFNQGCEDSNLEVGESHAVDHCDGGDD
ncbi:MAG: hypothetical protein IPG63_01685 [Xanthomonadales bacterium]|nr:hypothetical protein [Xanthomonadales bacterium]